MISDKSIARSKNKRQSKADKASSVSSVLLASTFNRIIAIASAVCSTMEHPLLASLVIRCNGNRILIMSQDTRTYFTGQIDLINAGSAKNYDALVPAAVLARVASKLVAMGELEIDFDSELLISSPSGFRCGLAPLYEGYGAVGDYPAPDYIDKLENSFTLDTANFMTAIEYAAITASKDSNQGLLNGVRFDSSGGIVSLAAMDGIQTAKASYIEPKASDFCVVLPIRFVDLLKKSYTDQSKIEIRHGTNQYSQEFVEFDIVEPGISLKIASSVISGAAFPDIDKIIKDCKPNSTKFTSFAEVEISNLASLVSSRLFTTKDYNLFIDSSYVDFNVLALHTIHKDPDKMTGSCFLECSQLNFIPDIQVCVAADKVASAIASLKKVSPGSKVQIWCGTVLLVLVIGEYWFAIARKTIKGKYEMPKLEIEKHQSAENNEGAAMIEVSSESAENATLTTPDTDFTVPDPVPDSNLEDEVPEEPALLPLAQQYRCLKEEYSDFLLVMEIGDFYEALWKDAEALAKSINLALTTKKVSKSGQRAPSSGFPKHALHRYLEMALEAGFNVAVASLEDGEYQVKVEQPVNDF
jgi:DNA polymerase III sliding clamp (beta) subunit (PCNA family)